MPRDCIFCDQHADTKEDAWPVWLVEALRTGDVIRITRAGSSPLDFRQDDIAMRVGVVCRPCNNGWMSRLEALAKPILLPLIKGETAVLGARAQATIASWAVKTAMVFEYTLGKDPRIYWRQEEREAFAAPPHVPPPDTVIWIAGYSGTQTAAVVVGPTTIRRLGSSEDVAQRCSLTLMVRPLVLQLDHDRYQEVTGNMCVVMGRRLLDRTEIIWLPKPEGIAWPLAAAGLNNDEFEQFTSAPQ